jgi:hypothetical protein
MAVSELTFHSAVLDMIGLTPTWSADAANSLRAIEVRDGFLLPPSVAEWYELDGADRILLGKSECQLLPEHALKRLEWKQFTRDSETIRLPLYEDAYEEMSAHVASGWRTTPISDMAGTISLGTDREGISDFVIKLDGSADPPVYNIGQVQWPDWWLWDPQFSGFVFSVCADTWLRPADSEVMRMEAQSRWPSPDVMGALARILRVGPQYADGPLPRSQWFYSTSATLRICDPSLAYGCDNPDHDAVWTILAGYEESVEELKQLVNSALGAKLRFLGR